MRKAQNSKVKTQSYCLNTYSAKETVTFGEKIGKALQANDVLALIGDLGAGKTTLMQGLAKGLGVSELVTSPTFTLINQYIGKLPVFHIDLYRLDQLEQIQDLGIEEYLTANGVCVIEWAERMGALLPKKAYKIELKYLEENERQICVSLELAARLK